MISHFLQVLGIWESRFQETISLSVNLSYMAGIQMAQVGGCPILRFNWNTLSPWDTEANVSSGEEGSKAPIFSPHPSWPCPICCVDGQTEAVQRKGLAADTVNMLTNLGRFIRSVTLQNIFLLFSLLAGKYVQKPRLVSLSLHSKNCLLEQEKSRGRLHPCLRL